MHPDGRNRSNIFRVNIDIVTESDPGSKPYIKHGEAGHHHHSEPLHHRHGEAGHHSIEEPAKLEPNKENKVYKPKKSHQKKQLEQWESEKGAPLSAHMIASWAKTNNLSFSVIQELIEEFRIEMMAKAKEYADFCAAFQVYLTKGYLSKTLAYAQKLSQQTQQTTVAKRGVDL